MEPPPPPFWERLWRTSTWKAFGDWTPTSNYRKKKDWHGENKRESIWIFIYSPCLSLSLLLSLYIFISLSAVVWPDWKRKSQSPGDDIFSADSKPTKKTVNDVKSVAKQPLAKSKSRIMSVSIESSFLKKKTFLFIVCGRSHLNGRIPIGQTKARLKKNDTNHY